MTALLTACVTATRAQQDSSARWQLSRPVVDFPVWENDRWNLPVYITSSKDSVVELKAELYVRNGTETVRLLKAGWRQAAIAQGANALLLSFKSSGATIKQDDSWFRAARALNTIPAGEYTYVLTVYNTRSKALLLQDTLTKYADSLIPPGHVLGKKLSSLLGNGGSGMEAAFARRQPAIEHYFRKKGIRSIEEKKDSSLLLHLYYDKWYLGQYDLPAQHSTASFHNAIHLAGSTATGAGRKTIENYQSLLSRFRELNATNNDSKELTGDLSLAANFASAQEPNSQLDNNYYEARGNIALPIFNIPVEVSGFYTTQDRHRKAKSSYLHFRYNAEKAKEELMKLLEGFNSQYQQAATQGGSYEVIYGQFLNSLSKEKDNALAGFKKQYGLSEADLAGLNEAQLKTILEQKAQEAAAQAQDSLENVSGAGKDIDALNRKKQEALAAQQKALAAREKAMENYRRLLELQKKIEKYQALIEQYRAANYYDSALAYDKVKDLKNLENMSYKDMAKKASGLLPEGKTKNMITGLVSFDAGMFPQYVSDYTMSGQMMKGLDMSYDAGIGIVGASYGKTEYVGRDGDVEGYKSYSGRLQFKPIARQVFGVVYYGYSPARSLIEGSGFFKDASVSMPSFRNPVHILSTTYQGNIADVVKLSGEYAFSSKAGQAAEAKEQISFPEKSAYNLKAEAAIPETNITLETGYEHAGKSFENNTLPVTLAGTDRFSTAVKGDFFKNFITLGAEYNYLIQRSFYSKGSNSRWGFDIATHSRRYPSVSLSYKPFATFRSFNDTLTVAQKPISGEVWTGKASYQVKRLGRAIRFTGVYSRNSSNNDTIHYQSTTMQFSTVYSFNTLMLMATAGHSEINTDYIQTVYPIYNNSWFGNFSWSNTIAEKLNASAGADIAKAGPVISKYGFFVTAAYPLGRLPLVLRANFRYSNYRLTDQAAPWQQLYSGGLELVWRIKEKLYND